MKTLRSERAELLSNIVESVKYRDYCTYLIECYKSKVKLAYLTEYDKIGKVINRIKNYIDNHKQEGDEFRELLLYFNSLNCQVKTLGSLLKKH